MHGRFSFLAVCSVGPNLDQRPMQRCRNGLWNPSTTDWMARQDFCIQEQEVKSNIINWDIISQYPDGCAISEKALHFYFKYGQGLWRLLFSKGLEERTTHETGLFLWSWFFRYRLEHKGLWVFSPEFQALLAILDWKVLSCFCWKWVNSAQHFCSHLEITGRDVEGGTIKCRGTKFLRDHHLTISSCPTSEFFRALDDTFLEVLREYSMRYSVTSHQGHSKSHTETFGFSLFWVSKSPFLRITSLLMWVRHTHLHILCCASSCL